MIDLIWALSSLCSCRGNCSQNDFNSFGGMKNKSRGGRGNGKYFFPLEFMLSKHVQERRGEDSFPMSQVLSVNIGPSMLPCPQDNLTVRYYEEVPSPAQRL
jgi:hypothetical protein